MNNLNKILDLIKKTGDKMVVTDRDGEESFVIMPLFEYEEIVDSEKPFGRMSEKELLDSVERDIAVWRAEHGDELFRSEYPNESELPEFMDDEQLEEPEFFEDEEDPVKSSLHSDHGTGDEDEEIEVGEGGPIKYEDIPPPPSIEVSDIMEDDTENETPVIDMSLNDEEEKGVSDASEEGESEWEEEGFAEEPVF